VAEAFISPKEQAKYASSSDEVVTSCRVSSVPFRVTGAVCGPRHYSMSAHAEVADDRMADASNRTFIVFFGTFAYCFPQ
jgi:hypothetical protein